MENRKPRKGELNHELEKTLTKLFGDCRITANFIPSLENRIARLAKKFSVTEYQVEYDRNVSVNSKLPWVVDGVTVIMFRRRSNGTVAIHRASTMRYPTSQKRDDGLVNLSAKRSRFVSSTVDEKYSWEHYTILKPRKSLVAKWNKQ